MLQELRAPVDVEGEISLYPSLMSGTLLLYFDRSLRFVPDSLMTEGKWKRNKS